MKTLLEILREPLVIGSGFLAIFIVVGAYILSLWRYNEFDVKDITLPESVDSQLPISDTELPPLVYTDTDLAFSEPDTPVESSSESESLAEVEEDYELTPEDEALLLEHFRETLPPVKESPHGLGPYPEIPPDYPKPYIFDRLEKNYALGRATVGHELIARVLIELWHQGLKTDSAIRDGNNGRVYPLYKDTVYVKWKEFEHEDGRIETYLGNYLSHGDLADYRDAVANGTQPSWLTVIPREDGGIAPYSFLDLP